MKVGDLVEWCDECPKEGVVMDYGIVLETDTGLDGVYVRWFGGPGTGWFDASNPKIGVISEAR